MELTASASEWLPWLGRVRFLIITFLLAVVVVVHQFTPVSLPVGILVSLCGVWYVFASIYVILQRALPGAGGMAAPNDSGCSIITGVVYSSGAQDSYFISLYLLAILMGSILFSRRGAFLVAGFAFVLLGCVVEMMYYGCDSAVDRDDARGTRSGNLAGEQSFRVLCHGIPWAACSPRRFTKRASNWNRKSEALKDLQAFNQDIIESMRGGLLTTDLEGRILLINRAGVEITGHGFGLMRGENVAEALPGILAGRSGRTWKSARDAQGDRIFARPSAKPDSSGYPSRRCDPRRIRPAASYLIFRISRS